MSSQVLVSAGHAGHPQERVGAKDLVEQRAKGTGRRVLCALLFAVFCPLPFALCPVSVSAAAAAEGGTIKGRVTFTGKESGNRVIRMGMDPMCAAANAGKRP